MECWLLLPSRRFQFKNISNVFFFSALTQITALKEIWKIGIVLGKESYQMKEAQTLLKPETMFGNTSFHLLKDLSWQEEAAMLSCHLYGEEVTSAHLEELFVPCQSWNLCAWVGQARIKNYTMHAFNQQVLLPRVPPGYWLSQHKSIPTFSTLFVAFECLLTTFCTPKH